MTSQIKKLDGTVVEIPAGVAQQYPYQVRAYAEQLAKQDTDPQVYVVEMQFRDNVVVNKVYSDACWNLESFALEMFEQMCKDHDWYYEYSDDHNVWTKGRVAYARLQSKYQWMLTKCPEAANVIWESTNPFLKEKAGA
jgi:hypothetical protein